MCRVPRCVSLCARVRLVNHMSITKNQGKLLPDVLPGWGRCDRIQARRLFGGWRNLDLNESETADRLVRLFTARCGSVPKLSY